MIIDFSFCNNKSFREENTFSMEAADYTAKEKNVVTIPDTNMRCLNVGVLYGANASGKSNLILLLKLFCKVVSGQFISDMDNGLGYLYFPFILDDVSLNKPAKISLRLYTNNHIYKYSIEYNGKEIMDESLFMLFEEEEKEIFHRDVSASKDEKDSIAYGNFYDGNKSITVESNAMLLTAFLTNHDELISPAVEYIRNIQFNDILYNDYRFISNQGKNLAEWLNSNEARKKNLMTFLRMVNTGIDEVQVEQDTTTKKYQIQCLHDFFVDGIRQKNRRALPIELESEGSRDLIFLGVKVVDSILSGTPLIIDELGKSFHTQVSQAIVDLYRDPDINCRHSQLIASTHDINLMDESRLRRDQVWFVEKNKEGVSTLFSLVEFRQVHEDTPFAKWYMANRFGALPQIKVRKSVIRHETK